MNISNPQETERVWMAALEEESSKITTNVDAMVAKAQGQPLTPEEIVAILNYYHASDQYFFGYVPTANALAELNYPRLSERLAQVRQDIQQSIASYSGMYRDAVNFRSEMEQLESSTQARMTQMMAESAAYTSAVAHQTASMYNLTLQGVPYDEALALSRQGVL